MGVSSSTANNPSGGQRGLPMSASRSATRSQGPSNARALSSAVAQSSNNQGEETTPTSAPQQQRQRAQALSVSSSSSSEGYPPLLYLFLGYSAHRLSVSENVSSSASSSAANTGLPFTDYLLPYLHARDWVQLLCLSANVRTHLFKPGIEYTRCRDGHSYQVPFPGFPGLLRSARDSSSNNNNNNLPPHLVVTTKNENSGGLFPHQLASLGRIRELENPENVQFGDLRGGILGDAPGLGKTITVLALISSTAGVRPLAPTIAADPAALAAGWKALTQNTSYREDLNRALKPIRKWSQQQQSPTGIPSVQSVISKAQQFPLPFDTFGAYCRHFRQEFKALNVPTAELDLFARQMFLLRLRLDPAQRSFFASEQGRRLLLEHGLTNTSATLIVVPDPLLEHWFEQILRHLDLELFADSSASDDNNGIPRGVVYLDGVGDIADASVPLSKVRLNRDMPAADDLVRYLIVVTTFSRCETEYQAERARGRLLPVESSNKSSNNNKNGLPKRPRCSSSRHGAAAADDSEETIPPMSPLLQLRWLRLIVDEGHDLGGHSQENAFGRTRLLHEVAAERRWVLSGTPTTGDIDSADYQAHSLDQLQRLLCFLRHPEYGAVVMTPDQSQSSSSSPAIIRSRSTQTKKRCARELLARQQDAAHREWEVRVKKPFLARQQQGRDELLRVLQSIMVMHLKEYIHLPRPIFVQGQVGVTVPAQMQQQVVDLAASSSPRAARILLDQYLESAQYQTMVDVAQSNYIVQSIRKARDQRRQLRGGVAEDVPRNIGSSLVEYNESTAGVDRRPIKAVVYSSSNNSLLSVAEHLYRQLGLACVAEILGELDDMSMELSRFRNGIQAVKTCPVCNGRNSMGNNPTECQRTLMEVVEVGDDRRRFLIEPERVRHAVPINEGGNVSTTRMDDILLSEYCQATSKWEKGDILEVDVRDPHPFLPRRKNEHEWDLDGAHKCRQLAHSQSYQGQDWYFGPFSSREEEDNRGEEERQGGPGNDFIRVTLEKWQRCGRFHNHRRWYKGPTFMEAPTETIKEDVFVLVLNQQVSHGLDLSFVTHIYLLEPIEDAALLQQVTSRAHRLGATGPVTVETVNVWQLLDDATKNATKEVVGGDGVGSASWSNSGSGSLAQQQQPQEHQTEKAICHYCCRSFADMAKALEHEATNCSQNPNSSHEEDAFELASLYREIRPPSEDLIANNQGTLN